MRYQVNRLESLKIIDELMIDLKNNINETEPGYDVELTSHKLKIVWFSIDFDKLPQNIDSQLAYKLAVQLLSFENTEYTVEENSSIFKIEHTMNTITMDVDFSEILFENTKFNYDKLFKVWLMEGENIIDTIKRGVSPIILSFERYFTDSVVL